MRKLRIGLVALSALVLGAGSAHAQRFGAQVNWAEDADLGLGARAELPLGLGSEGVLASTYLIGSFDYFFPSNDNLNYFEFNANVAVPVDPASALKPYVGTGLNMARWSVDSPGGDNSNTDLGLNLLGGIKFALGNLASFAEARLELGGGEQFVLTFGVIVGENR
jgi:opacity protein-like surface antigen